MKRAGFTLLEVMLTLLLVAIMMSVLYGVVVSTIQAQRRVEEVTYAAEIGPTLLDQIRRDFETAVRVDGEEEFFVGLSRSSGSGDWDRLDFVATVMSYGSEDEYEDPAFHSVNEVGYQVLSSRAEPSVGVLYRRLDFFIDDDPLRGGRLTELYHRVLSFDVKYHDGEEWVEEWTSGDREGALPKAIKVELKVRVTEHGEPAERTYSTVVTREE